MIEVLKQALDALETEVSIDWTNNDEFNASAEKMHDAIASLHQAIAELESQEPVAWADMGTRDVDNDAGLSWTTGHFHTTPLYIHPPQRTWQGLTNDELTDLFYNTNLGQASAVAQAIALLKQKNGFAEEKNT